MVIKNLLTFAIYYDILILMIINNQNLKFKGDICMKNKLQPTEYEKVNSFLVDEFKNIGVSDRYTLLATAYAIVKNAETNTSDFSSIDSFIATVKMSDDIREFIAKMLSEKWDVVIKVKSAFTSEVYKAFLLFNSNPCLQKSEYDTPKSIIDLTLSLLNIEPTDSVGNFCCGEGTFIRDAVANHTEAKYHGFEINFYEKCIAEMRAEFLEADIKIDGTDVLTLNLADKFTKIFSNFPFMVKISDIDSEILQYIYKNIPEVSRRISSDWVFLTSIINNLDKNGKAVAIITPNSTTSRIDKEVRKFFVENGFIESVIALPKNLMDFTSIPVIMIVLSFGNTEITFVNAIEEFTQGRRKNSLSADNIQRIEKATKQNTDISITVPIDKIAENSFDLYPTKYISNAPKIKNGKNFGSVIKNIRRGANIKADELDTLMTNEHTGLYYLMLNDIQDGIVNDNLPNISEIKHQYEGYCIDDKAFILSRNGSVFKSAFIETKPNEKILVNSNMYIIHFDYDEVNPYYLKAFFDSETGQTILRNNCAGSSLLTISIEELKNLVIPIPDGDKQKQIAYIYRGKLEEIKILREKLLKANNERIKIYDDFS